MARTTTPIEFGELLRQPAAEFTILQAAQALRVPITTLSDLLRRRSEALPPLTPSQARVLSQLSAGDSLTISTLAQAQQLVVSSMTEVVSRLADMGFVLKTPSLDDRREVRVTITTLGRKTLQTVLDARTEELRDRLERLSETELANVIAALPALWRLAELDADIWPRVRERPPVRRRRSAASAAPRSARATRAAQR